MEWTVTAPVISHEKNYRFHPITNRHHEIIIKYCMGKDDGGLVMYLKDMLKQLVVDDVDIESIPALDQLFLLIRLRSLCIGTRLDVILESENKSKHRISLIDIQKSINEYYIQPTTISDSTGTVQIHIHYTSSWTSHDLIDYIQEVTIDDTPVKFKQLSSEQQKELVEHLDTNHTREVEDFITKLENSITKMVFVQIPGEEDNITMASDQFTHILRIVYSDTLNNFVELMYVFVKILNFTLSDVMNLTPSDTQMYYQMFVKETAEREKAQKQSQAQNSSRSVSSRG